METRTGTRIESRRMEEMRSIAKKTQKSRRRHVGNGGDLDGKRKKSRKGGVGPVAANPDNLENNKEAGGGAQGTQGLSRELYK